MMSVPHTDVVLSQVQEEAALKRIGMLVEHTLDVERVLPLSYQKKYVIYYKGPTRRSMWFIIRETVVTVSLASTLFNNIQNFIPVYWLRIRKWIFASTGWTSLPPTPFKFKLANRSSHQRIVSLPLCWYKKNSNFTKLYLKMWLKV